MTERIDWAGCVIPDTDNRILMVRRTTAESVVWRLPADTVQDGEDAKTVALRAVHTILGVEAEIVRQLDDTTLNMARTLTYRLYEARLLGRPAIQASSEYDEISYARLGSFGIGRSGLSPTAEKLVWRIQNGEVNFSKRFV